MVDGHIVYQGTASDSVRYSSTLGCPIHKFENPADVYMRHLSITYPKTEEDDKNIQKMVNLYETHFTDEIRKGNELLSSLNFEVSNTNLQNMAPFHV